MNVTVVVPVGVPTALKLAWPPEALIGGGVIH